MPPLTTASRSRDEDRERSRAAGFEHHLTKPIDMDTVLSLVAREA